MELIKNSQLNCSDLINQNEKDGIQWVFTKNLETNDTHDVLDVNAQKTLREYLAEYVYIVPGLIHTDNKTAQDLFDIDADQVYVLTNAESEKNSCNWQGITFV